MSAHQEALVVGENKTQHQSNLPQGGVPSMPPRIWSRRLQAQPSATSFWAAALAGRSTARLEPITSIKRSPRSRLFR